MSADYAPRAAQNTCQVFERGSTQLGLPTLPCSPASQESPPGMIYRSPVLGSVPVAPSASHPPTPSPRHFSNPSPREALISTGVTSSGLDQSQECQDLQSALSDHASSRSSVKDCEADNCATTPGLADQSPAWATYPSPQQVRVSTRRIPYQAQAQAYRAALKELATTKLVGGEKPISQAVFLRVVTSGSAAGKEISELFEFRRPCHKPHSNASTILNLNEKQHNAMYALAGCSDVTSVMSHVKKQVRDAMEEVYGIDKIRFRTWFKNRRSTPKKINLRMDKTPNPNRSLDLQHPGCDGSQHLVQADGEVNAADELMMSEAAKVGSKRQRSTGTRAAARPRAAPKAARSLSPKNSLNASPPPPSNVSISCRPSSAAMPATPDAPIVPPAYTLTTPLTCKPARRRTGQSRQDQQMEIMSHCLDPLPGSVGAYPQRMEGRMQPTPADARSPLLDRKMSMWNIPSEAVAAVAAAAAASACEQLLEGHPQHMQQQQQRGSSPRTPAMRQHMLMSAESTPPAVYSHAQAAYTEPMERMFVAKLEPSQEQQQLGSDPWFSNTPPDNMTAMPGLDQLSDVLDGNVGAGLEHMSDDDLWLDIFGFNQQQFDEPSAADTNDNMHAMSMQQQQGGGAWTSQFNAEESAWMAANSGYMQRRAPDAMPVAPCNGHGQFAMPSRAQEAELCNAHGMNARDAFIYGQSKMVHDALPEHCFPGHVAGHPTPSVESALSGFNPELQSGGRGPQDTQRVNHQSSVTMPVAGGHAGHMPFAGHQQPVNFHELNFLDDLPCMEEWQQAI